MRAWGTFGLQMVSFEVWNKQRLASPAVALSSSQSSSMSLRAPWVANDMKPY